MLCITVTPKPEIAQCEVTCFIDGAPLCGCDYKDKQETEFNQASISVEFRLIHMCGSTGCVEF